MKEIHYNYNIICELKQKVYVKFDACITEISDWYIFAYNKHIVTARTSQYAMIAIYNENLLEKITNYIIKRYHHTPNYQFHYSKDKQLISISKN